MKGLGLGEVNLADAHIHESLAQSQPSVPRIERSTGWLGFWEAHDDTPDFVVTESTPVAEDAADTSPNLA